VEAKMTMQLYDLSGADDLRFSPPCWRVKLALAHKGLEAETVPCRFGEIPEKVAFANHRTVPVLVDRGEAVPDSWRIANYLEDAYADRPSLFDGEAGRALARFVDSWSQGVLLGAIAKVVIADVFDCVHPDDKAYFKESREKRLGSFEELEAQREGHLASLRAVLTPLKMTLAAQPYISGEKPLYPDISVFGTFLWPHCTSDAEALFAGDEALLDWWNRMMDLYGGLGRKANRRAA
jgi:glutathione S-transferase